jgi:hypothetical protein
MIGDSGIKILKVYLHNKEMERRWKRRQRYEKNGVH